MPFLAAGDPDMETSGAILRECVKRGADMVELGIPYSDPVADGPAIQAAFQRALNAGASLAKAFDMVRCLRQDVDAPIVSMLSYSIVHRVGPAEFMRRAAEAGLDGAIVPDLPVEESDATLDAADKQGLRLIYLAAPSTTESRYRMILQRAKGFLYCVSVAGVTGERDQLPADLVERVKRIKAETDVPVAVGFGISRPEHVRMVAEVADGAIVGSALVKAVHAAAEDGRDPVQAAGEFVAKMSSATR